MNLWFVRGAKLENFKSVQMDTAWNVYVLERLEGSVKRGGGKRVHR